MLQPFSLQIQDIQSDQIIAKSVDGQIWHLPISAVYGTPTIGQELRLIATTLFSEDAGKQAFAHAILNDLLGSTSS